jgi:hypothetical protein
MAKLANPMTRIVAIGNLKEYNFDESKPNTPGKGILIADNGNQVRFTIFNKVNGDNQHTKGIDFGKQYNVGDRIFITGQDGRQYSEKHNTWFENVSVWDYRSAEDEDLLRWVFVYVGDVKELTDDSLILTIKNFKNEDIIFPITLNEKTNKSPGIEVGARVKIKGLVFSGFKMDFYGDGDFATERTAAEIILVNTAAEVQAEESDSEDEQGLWS